MSRDLEGELTTRSAECGLPVTLLRTVYLRDVRRPSGSNPLDALRRVDAFIVYALTRDTRYAADRDLVPSART